MAISLCGTADVWLSSVRRLTRGPGRKHVSTTSMSTTRSETPDTTSVPPRAESRDDKMPGGIPFIVANEFAERFCYYGINAILSIYMTQFLRFGEAEATSFH